MKAGGPEAAALPHAAPLAPPPRPAWRPTLLALAVLGAVVGWLYRDTAEAMVAIWARSETFAHAYTVPPIVAWLIWRRRHALARLAPRPAAWLLLPIGLTAFGWLIGDLAAANALAQLAFTALLVLGFAALAGTGAARTLLFPLCFLFFAVPVGEFLMPQLMAWTADFTVLALRLSGIPVYREGQQFIIPSGSWSVVEACSGIRYLIASFMVGTLFAYLNYRSARRRLAFVAVSLAVPVVANWLRAYGIVMLGHLSGNQLAVGADHLIYGWLFFGVVILLMFFIGARWAEPDADPTPAPTALSSPSSSSSSSPSSSTGSLPGPAVPVWRSPPPPRADAAARRRLAATAGVALALVALPQAALWAIDRVDGAGSPPVVVAPALLGSGWRLAAQPPVDWKPVFHQPNAEVSAGYQAAQGSVGVYIGYFRQQTYARKLVSSVNQFVKSKDPVWALLRQGSRSVEPDGGRASTWRTALIRGDASRSSAAVPERLHAWQLYWVNGRFTASDAQARAWGALYRLLGRGDDAAVVVLFAPGSALQSSADDADTLLTAFARDNLGAIDALLRATRAAAASAEPPARAAEAPLPTADKGTRK